jgi:hypothetical protein
MRLFHLIQRAISRSTLETAYYREGMSRKKKMKRPEDVKQNTNRKIQIQGSFTVELG